MCDFVSWVEAKNKVYFLTGEQVNSPEFQERAELSGVSRDDYLGHGTIRWWYHLPRYFPLNAGNDRECTDFSSLDNFPPEIVDALKAGKFRGLGQQPIGLLNTRAQVKYEDMRDDAWAASENRANYYRVRDTKFWDLFANPANRAQAWNDDSPYHESTIPEIPRGRE